jgi:transcriptional regulator GlxA family with amidase domain
MHIAIVIFDGFDNLDAIGPFEVFNHARTFGAVIEVGLYTLAPQTVVTSSHGLRVEPDGVLLSDTSESSSQMEGRADELSDVPDLVVVPGGGWGNRAKEGAWGEAKRGDLPKALTRLHDGGATVASVCTGGMVLAHAGLTNDRPAVTHHDALADLHDSGAEVVKSRVVDDGDLVTAGGVTSGIDLALHLVEREFGRDIAEQAAAEMEYEPHGDVYQSTVE